MEELRVEQNRSTNKEELRYISNFWEETKVILLESSSVEEKTLPLMF